MGLSFPPLSASTSVTDNACSEAQVHELWPRHPSSVWTVEELLVPGDYGAKGLSWKSIMLLGKYPNEKPQNASFLPQLGAFPKRSAISLRFIDFKKTRINFIIHQPKKVTLIHFERSTRHHFRFDQLPTCPFVMAGLTGACGGA